MIAALINHRMSRNVPPNPPSKQTLLQGSILFHPMRDSEQKE